MSMSAATCNTLSQVIPVLLLAVVVEWRAFLTAYGPGERQAHVAVAGAMMIGLFAFGVVEALVLVGVQMEGLSGFWAAAGWLGFTAVLWTTLSDLAFGLVIRPLLDRQAPGWERGPRGG